MTLTEFDYIQGTHSSAQDLQYRFRQRVAGRKLFSWLMEISTEP
jgi:hypothetical protein